MHCFGHPLQILQRWQSKQTQFKLCACILGTLLALCGKQCPASHRRDCLSHFQNAWRCNTCVLVCRSPKPELLQLLFQHLPTLAKEASRSPKNSHHNGQLPHSNGHLVTANGNGHVHTGHNDQADGHQLEVNGQNVAQNSKQCTVNGHSDMVSQNSKYAEYSSGNSEQSSAEGAPSTQQPAVQVDGQSDGITKDSACQQAAELQHLLQEEVEGYLDKRHIVDILHDFSGSQPPLASFLSCLRPLQPRLYSISSSQQEHPKRVQITVAVVRYNALGRERIGVTSTFLKERMQVCTSAVVSAPANACPHTAHTPLLSTLPCILGMLYD